MKQVQLFHFAGCPYCSAAERWVAEVQKEHPELAGLSIERIDEHVHPDIADRYNYWFVPTFYVDGKKAHEGACTKRIVERVLLSALE